MRKIPRAAAACGLAAASTALALAGVSTAKTQVVKDPQDSPGSKLDIKRATAGQEGRKGRTLVHTVSFRSKIPRNPNGNICVDLSKRKLPPPPPPPEGEGPPPPPPPEGDDASPLPGLPIPLAAAGPDGDDGAQQDHAPADTGPLFVICTAPDEFNAGRVDVMRIDRFRKVGKARFRRRGSRKVEFSFSKKVIGLDRYYWKASTGYNGEPDSPCPPTTHGFGCFDDTKLKRFDVR
jgi:hypothetical protein